MIRGIFNSSILVLDKLKKQNYECYVLSNWSAETFVGMKDDYPFLRSFNGLLISGEDNMMKPNAEIYELAIARFNLIPQETVFIDDKLENIEAAKKLKLKTIHLVDPNKIELEIDKFLV
jgi:HAD superfamily hydrolase (TIGR01509 family)